MVAWLMVIAQSLLIIAARKHYSVDVVVAWYVEILSYHFLFYLLHCASSDSTCFDARYTVNLVVFFVDAKLPGFYILFCSFISCFILRRLWL